MTQSLEEKKALMEQACRGEVQRRCVNQLTTWDNLKIRELFPTDLGLKTDTWEIDLGKHDINLYNIIVDATINDKILCIYGFRIRGNDYPVTVVSIHYKEQKIKCYIEHLVDREYYIFDSPIICNIHDVIRIGYFIKSNKPSQIYFLGIVGERKV